MKMLSVFLLTTILISGCSGRTSGFHVDGGELDITPLMQCVAVSDGSDSGICKCEYQFGPISDLCK